MKAPFIRRSVPQHALPYAGWLEFGALAILVFAAYSNSFHGAFVFDSEPLILNDPRVHQVSAASVRAIFGQAYWFPVPSYSLYRPLVKLCWLFEYAVLGYRDQPFGYHLFNFAWHLLNVFLLWRLALAAGLRRSIAFFAALLFAVHPISTDAVANLAGRPDLMAAAFVLGGLLLHSRTGGKPEPPIRLTFALIAFAGILCKENAIVLLPAMIVFDAAFRAPTRGEWASRIPAYAATAAGVAAALLLRYGALSRLHARLVPFVDNPLLGLGFWHARLAACAVIVRYFGLLLWPATLSCDYSYNQIPAPTLFAGLTAFALVSAVFAAAVLSFRRSRAVFFSRCCSSWPYSPRRTSPFELAPSWGNGFSIFPRQGSPLRSPSLSA